MEGQLLLWGWTADDVYILSGPAYHAGPGGFTDGRALHRRAHGDPPGVRPASVAAARRSAPCHVLVHGAGALHPHPRGARRRACRARPLVAPADRARRRTVPHVGEAPHHRGARARGDRRALRDERRWRDPDLDGRVAGAARQRRHALAGCGGADPRRLGQRRPDGGDGRDLRATAGGRRVHATTTIPRRRPPRGRTTRSPSAMSATSTPTATSSSRIALPTW